VSKILGVGIAALDIINYVSHFPAEDEEMRATAQFIRRGGNVSNSLSVLSQLDHECFWSGTVGDDTDADLILTDFNSFHINTTYRHTIRHSKTPVSYIILNQRNGSRTIVHYRDLPELTFQHFSTLDFTAFDWIHFEARSICETKKMISFIKEYFPNILVSVEIEKQREYLEDIYDLANVYIFSKDFVLKKGYDDAETFLMNTQPTSPHADLICTWGKDGAYALPCNETIIQTKAVNIDNVIDTIGAGDTFNAGIIHARLNSFDWQKSLNYACEIAAKKCQQEGFSNLTKN